MRFRKVPSQVPGARSSIATSPASPGERVIRASASVIVAAFAVSMSDNLWYAIPTGLCAIFLMFSSIRGSCLIGRTATSRTADQQTTLNTVEARPTVTSDHH